MNNPTKTVVWILLSIAPLAIFGISFSEFDAIVHSKVTVILGITIAAWIGLNRVQIGTNDSLTFTHALGLFLGITIGPYPAIFTVTIGLLLSTLVDFLLKRYTGWIQSGRRGLLIISRQVVSLAGGMGIYLILGGSILAEQPGLPATFATIAMAVSFSLLFLSFHAIERWLRKTESMTRRQSLLVSSIALIPIPFVVIAAAAYSVFTTAALVIYGLILSFTAPILRTLLELQDGLVRKSRSMQALFDLATARDISPDTESYFALIDLAMSELGIGSQAALYLKDANNDRIQLVHTINMTSQHVDWSDALGESENDFRWMLNTDLEQVTAEDFAQLPQHLASMIENMKINHLVKLPLSAGPEMIGQLLIIFERKQQLSKDELHQLKGFGDQLSQSLKLSREFAATNAELKRRVEELARLESIGRQVTASIATEDVYNTIIHHAIQATSAKSGYLEILNRETGVLEPVGIDSEDLLEPFPEIELATSAHHIAQRAFDTGQVTNVADTLEDPEFVAGNFGSQSLLCTPIISQGETVGVITLEKTEPGGFTGEEEAFIIQLASQAANALRNATLYEELQQRLKEQSLLYQASAQIAESLDSNAVALALADSLAYAVNADRAYVYRYSDSRSSLELICGIEGSKTIEGRQEPRSIELETPGVKECIESRRPIQWTAAEALTSIDQAYLESRQANTILLIPLIVGERTLGLAELLRQRSDLFEEEELRTIQSIAIQASIMLENSDLFHQISRSNNRLSAVLNSTREGMLMIDKDGKVAVVNTQLEDLINVDPDLLSQTALQDLNAEVLQRLGYKENEVRDLIASLQSGKGHLPGVSTYELPHTERRILRRLETPVHDSHGKLIGWLIVIRDVSEEMQLEESRKHLTEMIVHDLRSPLSAILNSMELLRMQLQDDEPTPIMQQALAIADRSVHQMLGLVNALLDLSKLESGQFVLSVIEIDFHELIPHLIDTFLPEAEQAGVILDYSLDPGLPNMFLDEEKIFRVLSNLLDNALKFTPAGGKVVLEIRKDDQQLWIDVTDTGPGIPSEFREHIFDLYAQVPGTKGRRRGTGLGLAFCKLAVEAHHGEIWVEDNPDGGSRFRICLPNSNIEDT